MGVTGARPLGFAITLDPGSAPFPRPCGDPQNPSSAGLGLNCRRGALREAMPPLWTASSRSATFPRAA